MVMAPYRVPVVAGLNFILMVQLPPGATLVPQVLVWVYSFVPVMLEMFSVTVDEFDRVAFMMLLVLPTTAGPKLSKVDAT